MVAYRWALGALIVLATTQGAAAADRVDLTYRLFLGGLTVMELDSSTIVDGNRYRMESLVRTVSLWEAMFRARLASRVDGTLGDGLDHPTPSLYQTRYDGAVGKRSAVDIRYGDGAPVVTVDPPNADENRPTVEAALTAGTIDPSSALLFASRIAAEGRLCDIALPIYDGRRRYDIKATNLGDETLHSDDPGFYSGPATRCTVAYRRIKGYSERWEATQAKAWPSKATVWFARLDGISRPVPVKIMVSTELGWMVAQLVAHKSTRVGPLGDATALAFPGFDDKGG